MPGISMASAVDVALVDMQGTVVWAILYGVHWTRQGFNPLKNQPASFDLRSNGKRPDGLTLISWVKGRCPTWDVTVPDTFATSHIPSTSYLLGAAAERAETLKKQNYAALSQTNEIVLRSNWNKRCIKFWRVGVRQENRESNIQCIIRWKRDRLPVPAYISRDR